jgi:hypothetical protein
METITSVPSQFSVTTRPRTSTFTGGKCSALQTGNSAEQTVIAALGTLNDSCNTATGVVNQNPLGPYGSNGSCDFDCSYEQTWWWKADYRYMNANLVQAIGVVNLQGNYTLAYRPTQNWLSVLPNLNTAMLAAINAANFTDANGLLQDNINDVNPALQSIAGFVNNENQYAGYLQNYAVTSHNSIVQNATAIENDLIGKISCGSGDVQNSFNGMFADVSAKFVNMTAPFNTVNNNFQAALQAVELVAGVFLHIQSQNQLVGQSLTTAQSYPPNSPLQQMYLKIATNEWNDLVTQANGQLT